MRQKMRGRNVSGEGLVADGRVKERRGGSENGGETEGAPRAALFLGVGLWLVVLAVARVHFHLRAAIGLDHFEVRHLAGQGREGDRRTNRQANENAQDRSHFTILGGGGAGRKRSARQDQPCSSPRKVTQPLLQEDRNLLG